MYFFSTYRVLGHRFLSMCLSVILLISGCVSTKLASDAEDRLAKNFQPPPDKSYIYVMRYGRFVANGALMAIRSDGEFKGYLANDTYFLLEVAPGKHTVTAGYSREHDRLKKNNYYERTVEVQTAPGKMYFLEGRMTMSQTKLKVISKDMGKRNLENFRRAAIDGE